MYIQKTILRRSLDLSAEMSECSFMSVCTVHCELCTVHCAVVDRCRSAKRTAGESALGSPSAPESCDVGRQRMKEHKEDICNPYCGQQYSRLGA